MRSLWGTVSKTILLAACFATGLFAQLSSITGSVTDPTGSVIPNANITITNLGTGAERVATSDAQGSYTIGQVPPGFYKVTAKAPGFADFIVNRIELLVNEPATLDLKFAKLGSTTETVQVSAAAVQVNTTDASLGNAIGTNAIIEMPMYARNVVGLLAFQPGVTSYSSGGTVGANDGAVNGGKPDQGYISLDGADVIDQNARTAFTSVLRVTLDSVEEFRTTTTNGDAATGRGSGADVQLVTKSGTNTFHGSAYEYRRGTEMASNSFFNNQAGIARGALLINVFGGSAGGAVKKNKLFYFINYEGRRDASAGSATRTVPTANLRAGIVGYTNASNQVVNLTAAQAQTIDPAGIGVNQAALKQMSTMPLPNNTLVGDSINLEGYTFNYPSHSVQNTYISRIDYHVNDKNSLFIRGNLQNDSSSGSPQFPGLPSSSENLANSKGLAAGWTDVLSPNVVSTLHYGFTRAGTQSTGVLTSNYEWFRNVSTPYGTTTGTSRIVPVHLIGEDLNWNHGTHTLRFGGNFRYVSNQSQSYANSYSSASSNPSWLTGSGNDLLPASLGVSSSFKQNYEYAMAAVLGLEAQGNADYNYQVNGALLPVGAPVTRKFENKEVEMYAQDTWKVTREFTITAGIRLGLEPPVFEANGQQASTNIPLAAWLGARANYAEQGLSQQNAGLIDFIPASQGSGMYPFHKNWAPRIGLAYSPNGTSGLSRLLFGGPGKTSIRAGIGMYYDLVGQPLAQSFSSTTPGLSQSFSNPANLLNSAQVPRYTTFYAVPPAIVPAAPAGGLPLVYPYGAGQSGAFAITNSIDQQLAAPYTINLDFTIGRDLGHGFFLQTAYVGRLSRHSLDERDLAMPTNLVDPTSGQTYFQAMTTLMTDIDFLGMNPNTIPAIPFFQNMWPGAGGNGLTPTQVWANDYYNNSATGDATNTLNNADNAANCVNGGPTTFTKGVVNHIACGKYGPWMVFSPQFSALSAWSSLGKGDYHALQVTLRKRLSFGLQLDLNYTWSKSIDLGSAQEAAGSFSGFIQNTWNPSQQRAVSNYDTTQQLNSYGVYDLPFGRGRKFGTSMNRILDAVVGGWELSGTYRQTSGLPYSVGNGQRWPTDWEVSSLATPIGPIPVTMTMNAQGITGGGPNLFQHPLSVVTAPGEQPGQYGLFLETLAGQSGVRNNIRGPGFFNIDTGLYKVFRMPYSEHHQIQLRWETYNVTNSVSFNAPSLTDTTSTTFGKFSGTLNQPRQMQIAGRYTW
ncbi:MAG: carboxypeptidase-like regulatory domain-containing protein [Bryobacteraceae bacterium]|jgi:Carboxypeptidase regulatory-like domain